METFREWMLSELRVNVSGWVTKYQELGPTSPKMGGDEAGEQFLDDFLKTILGHDPTSQQYDAALDIWSDSGLGDREEEDPIHSPTQIKKTLGKIAKTAIDLGKKPSLSNFADTLQNWLTSTDLGSHYGNDLRIKGKMIELPLADVDKSDKSQIVRTIQDFAKDKGFELDANRTKQVGSQLYLYLKQSR